MKWFIKIYGSTLACICHRNPTMMIMMMVLWLWSLLLLLLVMLMMVYVRVLSYTLKLSENFISIQEHAKMYYIILIALCMQMRSIKFYFLFACMWLLGRDRETYTACSVQSHSMVWYEKLTKDLYSLLYTIPSRLPVQKSTVYSAMYNICDA